MKICFFISSLGLGGAERQASLLCNAWVQAGHDVILMLAETEKSQYQIDPRVRVESFRSTPARGRLSLHIADHRDIRDAIQRNCPDVVISFMDVMNLKVIAAAGRRRTPVVISERVVPSAVFSRNNGRLSGLVVAILRRLMYPKAAALVVQSSDVAEWSRRYRVSRKTSVISNMILAAESFRRETEEKVILTIGRLTYQKGHDILIRAFASIASEFPDWRVRIVGEGPLRSELSKLAKKLGIADRVELLGEKAELRDDYASAALFALTSRFEGFPNVLLEAMAFGCAIVASDCPGAVHDILRQGQDGDLFRSEDSSDLASKLKALMLDPDRRKQIGARARDAVARYAPSEVLPLWNSVLQAALGDKKESGPHTD